MRPIPKLTESDVARFWSKVDKTGDCWEWTAGKNAVGYGKFTFGKIVRYAHRVAYLIDTSVDPGDKHVCHTCDNPSCVNPTHLWLGTNQDNIDDSVKKGRKIHGSDHYSSKLTEADVEEILKSPDESGNALSERYGVCIGVISHIRQGYTWKHVGG